MAKAYSSKFTKTPPIIHPQGAKPSNSQDKLDGHRGTKKSFKK